MRALLVILGLLACMLPLPALAQEKAPSPPAVPPKPMTEDEAVAAVLEAWKTKDEALLRELGSKDEPDPWIVADALCARGEHDAASAFAKASPRPATERLPSYVSLRRGKPDGTAERMTLAAANEAVKGRRFQEALGATSGLDPPADTVVGVRIRFVAGHAQRGLRSADAGAASFLEAGRLAEALGWAESAKRAYREGGESHFSRARYRDAGVAWRKALAIAEEIGSRADAASFLGDIGVALEYVGEYSEALTLQERALAIREEMGDGKGVANALGNMGNLRHSLGDFARSLALQERVLGIMEGLGDRPGVARTHANIGITSQALGEFPKALSSLEKARVLMVELGDSVGAAQTLIGIGNVRRSLGDLPRALACQEEALRILREAGDRRGAAAALGNVAGVHLCMGDYATALSTYEKVLPLKEDLEDRQGIAATLGSIGLIYEALEDYPRALSHLQKALLIEEGIGNRLGVAMALGNIGNVLLASGDAREALSFQERALSLKEELGDREGLAATLANIALAHDALGEHREALPFLERALEIREFLGSRTGIAGVLGSMGSVLHRLRDFPRALARHEGARRLSEEAGDGIGVVTALVNISRIHLELEAYPQASAMAREAVLRLPLLAGGVSEEYRPQARQRYAGVFATGAISAATLGSSADVAFFLESGRAGALRESLHARERLREGTVPPWLEEEERVARGKEAAAAAALRRAAAADDAAAVKEARASLEAANADLRDAVARIQREARQVATVLYGAVDGLDTIRGRLRSDEALLLYGLFPRDLSFALVVTAQEARVVPLGETKALVEACSGLALQDDGKAPGEAIDALRDLVVKPLALGDRVRRVLVSPDADLCFVPFSLLVPGREVAYESSGTVHGLLAGDAGKRGEGVLALGDPAYREPKGSVLVASLRSGWGLAPLPGTRDEAKAVGSMLLLGKDATETRLQAELAKRPRWRSVHLACHGLVDMEHPQRSSLALSPDAENDGFLSVLDVFRMKCPADLVVLSACETGKGKVVRGEGIVGLTRAFMFAGAPRVLVSLWKVDDEATRALMVRFYELWNPKDGAKGLGAAAALKEAQAFVAAQPKWKHPRYWAAWVLWGLPD